MTEFFFYESNSSEHKCMLIQINNVIIGFSISNDDAITTNLILNRWLNGYKISL